MADGVLIFGTAEGVTAFRPSSLTTNMVVPPVAITSLEVQRAGTSDRRPADLDRYAFPTGTMKVFAAVLSPNAD